MTPLYEYFKELLTERQLMLLDLIYRGYDLYDIKLRINSDTAGTYDAISLFRDIGFVVIEQLPNDLTYYMERNRKNIAVKVIAVDDEPSDAFYIKIIMKIVKILQTRSPLVYF